MKRRGKRRPRVILKSNAVSECCKKPFYEQTIYYSEFTDGKAAVSPVGSYRACMGMGCHKAWRGKADIKILHMPHGFTLAVWHAMVKMENPIGRFLITRDQEGKLIPYGGARWMVAKYEEPEDETKDWAP